MELLHSQIYCWQDSCNYLYITKVNGTYEQFSMYALIFERLSNGKALSCLFSSGAIANHFDILPFCKHIDLFENNFCFFLFTFLENNLTIWLMYSQNPRQISLYIFEYGQEAALIMFSKKGKTNLTMPLYFFNQLICLSACTTYFRFLVIIFTFSTIPSSRRKLGLQGTKTRELGLELDQTSHN